MLSTPRLVTGLNNSTLGAAGKCAEVVFLAIGFLSRNRAKGKLADLANRIVKSPT